MSEQFENSAFIRDLCDSFRVKVENREKENPDRKRGANDGDYPVAPVGKVHVFDDVGHFIDEGLEGFEEKGDAVDVLSPHIEHAGEVSFSSLFGDRVRHKYSLQVVE